MSDHSTLEAFLSQVIKDGIKAHNALDIISNSKALDVGTDMFVFAILLAKQGAHVLGKLTLSKKHWHW